MHHVRSVPNSITKCYWLYHHLLFFWPEVVNPNPGLSSSSLLWPAPPNCQVSLSSSSLLLTWRRESRPRYEFCSSSRRFWIGTPFMNLFFSKGGTESVRWFCHSWRCFHFGNACLLGFWFFAKLTSLASVDDDVCISLNYMLITPFPDCSIACRTILQTPYRGAYIFDIGNGPRPPWSPCVGGNFGRWKSPYAGRFRGSSIFQVQNYYDFPI